MLFTKSISDQFWRSYGKKSIFFIFHFLKFLPISNYHCRTRSKLSSWGSSGPDVGDLRRLFEVPISTLGRLHFLQMYSYRTYIEVKYNSYAPTSDVSNSQVSKIIISHSRYLLKMKHAIYILTEWQQLIGYAAQ